MSRVVVATAFGGPEVLSVVDQPDAPPGPGEAVVDVRAAGINPADWKAYTGQFGRDEARLPLRLGYEVAGVVSAVGEGTTGPAGPVSVGDEVVGFRVQGGTPTGSSSRPRPSSPGRRSWSGRPPPGSC